MADFFNMNPLGGSKVISEKYHGFDSILTRSKITDNYFSDNYIVDLTASMFSLPFKNHEISIKDKRKTNINLEVIARDRISKFLKPYTKSKNGELTELTSSDIGEEIIASFILTKLKNPSPVVLWYNPKMVKLAEAHIKSRITEIGSYEKTKADLYQAIEDLEQSHQQFLKDSEAKIESVLDRGHNFIL
jgi:hypothetical protein